MGAGQPLETEVRLHRADGEQRWFLIRTWPLRDETDRCDNGTHRRRISRTAVKPSPPCAEAKP